MSSDASAVADLVLASASPRRRELLQKLEIPFTCEDPGSDGPVESENPAERVLAHARFKAAQIAVRLKNRWVLAADTLVFKDGRFYPKPVDRSEAASMLQSLMAATHQVWTGICLLAPDGHRFETADCAVVEFQEIPPADLSVYLEGSEWCDKAGAYAIQGWAGAFTSLLRGDYETVVGLSTASVAALLKRADFPHAVR